MLELIGLLLGIIVMLIFKQNSYHGPNSNDIKKNIYFYDGKYYVFKTDICPCRI